MQRWSLVLGTGIESDAYELHFGMSVETLQSMFNRSHAGLCTGISIDGSDALYAFDFDLSNKVVGIAITGNYGDSLCYDGVELLDTHFDKLQEEIVDKR